jgi:HEAT repeat protein
MFIRDCLARPAGPPIAAAALLLSLLAPLAQAQQSASPPVEAVRRALRLQPLPSDDPKEVQKGLDDRKQLLLTLTDGKSKLQDPGDIAQALLLPDWYEPLSGTAESRKVDQDVYNVLVTRFLGVLRADLKAADKTPDVRAAVVTFIGEFAASARSGVGGQRSNRLLPPDIPRFTEVVADVATHDPAPEPRVSAAGSLARLQSDPRKDGVPQAVTVPALESMLKSSDVPVRRAAAQALGDLLRGTRSADRGGYAASPLVEPSPDNLPEFGPSVAKAAGAVLNGKEPDADVRRLSADALVQVGSTLKTKLRPAQITDELHRQMRPVVDALWAQTAAIERACRDSDPRVRNAALRALEQMGDVRQAWLSPSAEPLRTPPPLDKPRGGSTKPPRLTVVPVPDEMSDLTLTVAVTQAQAVKPKEEPTTLADTIPAVVAGLRDERVRNRLTALDAMATITQRADEQRTIAQDLGAKPAAEAAKAVTRALGDSDRFVRWAAARTLGEMAPLSDVDNGESVERGAVNGLARLLFDADPDVRMWSAQALEKFGKAAQPAVPALAQAATNRGDLEGRISAAHAIAAIGSHAAEAVPALASDLVDPNVRMRRTAAEALSAYGPDAAPAKAALNRALFDPDPEVRRLASEAMLKIGSKR